MNRQTIIAMAVAIAMAFCVLYFGVSWYKCHRHDKETTAKNDTLQRRVKYCESVKSVIKVYQDSLKIKDSILQHPKPVKQKVVTILQKDSSGIRHLLDSIGSIWHDASKYLCDSRYDSVYRKGRFHFRWKLQTYGSLAWINFTDITIPKDSVVDTKVIDTCFTKPATKIYWPKNHFTLDLLLSGRDLKGFPGLKGVVGYSIKDKVRLCIGGEYIMQHNEANAILGVGWVF